MQQTDTTNILKGLKLLKWYTNSNSLLSILRTHTQCISEDVRGFTAGQKNCWKSGQWAAAGTMWALWPSQADCHWAVGHRPLSYRPAPSKTPPGHHSHLKTNWKQCLCKILWGQTRCVSCGKGKLCRDEIDQSIFPSYTVFLELLSYTQWNSQPSSDLHLYENQAP